MVRASFEVDGRLHRSALPIAYGFNIRDFDGTVKVGYQLQRVSVMPLGLQHGEQHNHQSEQVFFAHGGRLGGEDAPDSVVTTFPDKTLQGVGPRHADCA
jgi:hypothetical protein